jgi:hypothetical protein
MIVNRISIAFAAINLLAGILDGLRAQTTLPAATALTIRRNVTLVTAILAPAIETPGDVGRVAQTLIDSIAVLRKAAVPNDVAADLYAAATACSTVVPSTRSPALTIAARLADQLAACCGASYLAQAFVAEAKSTFTDQQTALDALARIGAAMDANTDWIAQSGGARIFARLRSVSMLASGHISTVATSLKPVVRVQTQYSAPASAIGWALYGDPSRAEDLVTRNDCLTPLFMPTALEALGPDA